ncbi:TPA: hypothetical protein ACXORL_001190, partial [Enterococcus faecium]
PASRNKELRQEFCHSLFFCTNTEKLAFEYRGVKRSPQDFYLFISLIAYIAAVLCCEKWTE